MYKLLDYLGVKSRSKLKFDSVRSNRSRKPVYHRMQLKLNWLTAALGSHYSAEDQRNVLEGVKDSTIRKSILKTLYTVTRYNCRSNKTYRMDPEIKTVLSQYYTRENAGLSDLTGIDLKQYWKLDV